MFLSLSFLSLRTATLAVCAAHIATTDHFRCCGALEGERERVCANEWETAEASAATCFPTLLLSLALFGSLSPSPFAYSLTQTHTRSHICSRCATRPSASAVKRAPLSERFPVFLFFSLSLSLSLSLPLGYRAESPDTTGCR